ncbi:MAG: CDP-2,3-bis-(O-geranylgeranyl)-sn-glycerol synthase [Methanobacterium sp.]|jgi:CDP-2,3-bis-(O-geranylgeranyl)-sn-glycerol synthase|nr:CDP-2,3-bis-(O-geranylgeranyl)-sn-glycerol synthase [Methanobacterium sp.]
MDSIISFLSLLAYALYFMLPAYLANVSALAFGGGTPVDFQINFRDGRRLLGDGVTWRGTIVGIIIGTIIAALQGIVFLYYGDIFLLIPGWTTIAGIIPSSLGEWVLLGLALSGGALVGDAVGSFIKRRINLERGRPAPFMDQLDFVVGALVFASLVVTIPFNIILLILIFTAILHLAANSIAYLLGLKNVWY